MITKLTRQLGIQGAEPPVTMKCLHKKYQRFHLQNLRLQMKKPYVIVFREFARVKFPTFILDLR